MVILMTDLNVILAGLARLLCPILMLIFWRKKTRARLLPAFAAFAACIPAFIIAGAIRSGFDHDAKLSFYIQQGLLYGIFEEGTKFLTLNYLLTSYGNRKDAVTYSIGHSYFEEFGGGMACLDLIGKNNAAPDILWVNLFGMIEGTAFVVSLTVIIFYGIQMRRSKITLPAAMLLHAVGNMTAAIGMSVTVIGIISILITIAQCFAAFRCWQTLRLNSSE